MQDIADHNDRRSWLVSNNLTLLSNLVGSYFLMGITSKTSTRRHGESDLFTQAGLLIPHFLVASISPNQHFGSSMSYQTPNSIQYADCGRH
jgi:hypothetical protein